MDYETIFRNLRISRQCWKNIATSTQQTRSITENALWWKSWINRWASSCRKRRGLSCPMARTPSPSAWPVFCSLQGGSTISLEEYLSFSGRGRKGRNRGSNGSRKILNRSSFVPDVRTITQILLLNWRFRRIVAGPAFSSPAHFSDSSSSFPLSGHCQREHRSLWRSGRLGSLEDAGGSRPENVSAEGKWSDT